MNEAFEESSAGSLHVSLTGCDVTTVADPAGIMEQPQAGPGPDLSHESHTVA